MTRSEVVRHNAKILLPRVRGKSKRERAGIYEFLRFGPLFVPLTLFVTYQPKTDPT